MAGKVSPLLARGASTSVLAQVQQPPLGGLHLRTDVVVLNPVEGIPRGYRAVQPDSVLPRFGRQMPEKRRLAAAARISLEVTLKSVSSKPVPKVVAQYALRIQYPLMGL